MSTQPKYKLEIGKPTYKLEYLTGNFFLSYWKSNNHPCFARSYNISSVTEGNLKSGAFIFDQK